MAHTATSDTIHCRHAEQCGGCPLIDYQYLEQLERKRQRVRDSSECYPALRATEVAQVRAAEPITRYRARAKLIVAPGPRLGLFAKGGHHEVIDIPECHVLSPALSELAQTLRRWLADADGVLAPFDPQGRGMLRAVDLREVLNEAGEAHTLLTLVVERSRLHNQEAALRTAAERLREECPSLLGVAVSIHDGLSPQVLGHEIRVLAGAADAIDTIGGSAHLASYGSFVQAHRGQAAAIHERLAEWLRVGARPTKLLDVYGGSGAIALALARRGAVVHVVESFPPAVEKLSHYARTHALPVTAEAADAASAARKLAQRGVHFDAVIVNPPRRGVNALGREWLSRLGADELLYISCEPNTLARDLDHLQRLGYRAEELLPFDMIPLTEEVETVARLRRGPPPSPSILFEDDELLLINKDPHEPTTPHEGYQRSAQQRLELHAEPGAAKLFPLLAHEPEISGVAAFAKGAAAAARHSELFANARLVFVGAVRGIASSKAAIGRALREGNTQVKARTRYRRLALCSGHSVLRIIPEQRHPHQIRRHLASIGHPLLGDDRFGHAPSNRFFEERHGLDRTFLHCVRIELTAPDGSVRQFDAPLPGDLRSVLERAGGSETLEFLDSRSALGVPHRRLGDRQIDKED